MVSVELRAGSLGDADAAPVLAADDADAGGLVVLGVEDGHIGDVDPALLLDHADLQVRAARHGALVALDHVQALDVDLVVLDVDAQDLARLALVLAGDDDDRVVGLDAQRMRHGYSTSGASETIFM